MWRSILSGLASLLIVLACCLPAARAQLRDADTSRSEPAPTAPGPSTPKEGGGVETGPFPWVVAFLFTAVILLVVCMPSRKN